MNAQASKVINIPVSADEAISIELDRLMVKFNDEGARSLSPEEWAMKSILGAAKNGVGSGHPDVDFGELKANFVNLLSDEGPEKWSEAFDAALEKAQKTYFPPHPDSE